MSLRSIPDDGQPSEIEMKPPELFRKPAAYFPVLKNILNYASLSDMKNFRQINKSWDVAVYPAIMTTSDFLIDLDVPLTRTTPENLPVRRVFLHFSLDDFRKKAKEQMARLEATFPSTLKPTLLIRRLHLTLSVLIANSAIDGLISWLEVYGSHIESLQIDKQEYAAFRGTVIGTFSSLLNANTLFEILRTMPQLRHIQITAFRLLTTPEQMETLLVLPPFPEPVESRVTLEGDANLIQPENCYPCVKSLTIHDVYPSHKNSAFIRSFTNLEKLTLSFSPYARPGLKLETLGIQSTLTNLLELELFSGSGGITQFGAIALGHLSRIDFIRLAKLKIDGVRFLDGDNMDEQLSLACLLGFFNKVNTTLTTLDMTIQCSRISWNQLCNTMPEMSKLKTFRIKLLGESSRDPLLQMLPKLPSIETLSISYEYNPFMNNGRNTKSFRLINHRQIAFGSNVKMLSIEKMETPFTRPSLTQLILCFNQITHLDIPVWCTKVFTLKMHWQAINQLSNLKELKLNLMRIIQQDFVKSISDFKSIKLSSLSFIIRKLSTKVQLRSCHIRKSFQCIPNLRLLEFKGFTQIQDKDKTQIEEFFACKSPFLCVKIHCRHCKESS